MCAGVHHSDPPFYEYIHLRYPDKAKEAVCALNIDFKREPCYKTARKKGLNPAEISKWHVLMEKSGSGADIRRIRYKREHRSLGEIS